jgi:hypothetical protein
VAVAAEPQPAVALQPDGVDPDLDTLEHPTPAGHHFESAVFSAGWITDVGKVRSHNEDGIFVFLVSSKAITRFHRLDCLSWPTGWADTSR